MPTNGEPKFREGETYPVEVVACHADTSRTRGTPYLDIKFRVVDGEMANETIHYEMYSTQTRKEMTLAELAILGFAANGDWDSLPDFLVGRECSITVRIETFNNKDRWKVDRLLARGARMEEGGPLGAFARILGGVVTGKPKPKTATGEEVPF